MTTPLHLPADALCALIGPPGSGKTTFARQHFTPTQVLSSDFCRALVADDFSVKFSVLSRTGAEGSVTSALSLREKPQPLSARYSSALGGSIGRMTGGQRLSSSSWCIWG
ncbi:MULTISPECIES: AAA family ATPase [unclassified Streptomyces]|uniref:AAA family ATPase n=1 Tax=unclassified Streptomyces TaxID=2593676 RepID=UPI0004BDD558|nr:MULTISPECIES: AAA family ATPase [unclassified Streptomyces]